MKDWQAETSAHFIKLNALPGNQMLAACSCGRRWGPYEVPIRWLAQVARRHRRREKQWTAILDTPSDLIGKGISTI